MSTSTTHRPHTLPFPLDTLHTSDVDDQERNIATAETFRRGATLGILMSLGATDLHHAPGMHQLGGLVFTARILPMTLTGRGQAPRRMLVMISSTPDDLIDIDVRQITTGANHATARGIYIDQLQSVLLALDYDGRNVFNPRYWTN